MNRQLMSYLDSYGASSDMRAFQGGLQSEADLMWESREDFLSQLDPKTATWGLDKWEAAFGIPVDPTKDPEYRRTRIVSKIRGSGTTTAALIKSVAESFSNGTVAVYEFFGEYLVEVHFTGTIGIPPNLDDLEDALNDVMPAHLVWEFKIYYRTQAGTANYTHAELAQFTHAAIREEDLSANDT